MVQGKTKEMKLEEYNESWENLTVREHVIKYIDEGMSKKDAIKKVAKDRGVIKGEIYKESMDIE